MVEGVQVHDDAVAAHDVEPFGAWLDLEDVRAAELHPRPHLGWLVTQRRPGHVEEILGQIDAYYVEPRPSQADRLGALATAGVEDANQNGRAARVGEVRPYLASHQLLAHRVTRQAEPLLPRPDTSREPPTPIAHGPMKHKTWLYACITVPG